MATSKIPTMLRLPETIHGKIKQLAQLEHRSLNMEIEYALSKYIDEYEKANGAIELPSPGEDI